MITDVQLAGISGPDLYRRLRELRPELRCLLSSGSSAEDVREQYGLAEIGFLHKPWTPLEVTRAVREVLDGAT